jgi:magnesium-transporting ATPase (P-type)
MFFFDIKHSLPWKNTCFNFFVFCLFLFEKKTLDEHKDNNIASQCFCMWYHVEYIVYSSSISLTFHFGSWKWVKIRKLNNKEYKNVTF